MVGHMLFQPKQKGFVMLRSIVLVSFGVFLISCSEADAGKNTDNVENAVTPEQAYAELMDNGLSCGTQEIISRLGDAGDAKFGQMVRENVSEDVWWRLVSEKATGCSAKKQLPEPQSSIIEESTYAITGTYAVEPIEKVSSYSVGWSPTSIYRDGSAYGNMCGNDLLKDYIAEFNGVSGAFNNRGSLRIMGLNSYGNCYLKDPTMARIYSDNSIRACYGYLTVVWCWGAQTYDTRIWRAY